MKKTMFATALVLVLVLMVGIVHPSKTYAASETYSKTGKVFPDIIGLGACDKISYTVTDGVITNVVVSQESGSCLGVINVKPKSYELKDANTLVCKWKLTVSAPFKIFNLEKGIRTKTVEYKLGTDGTVTMTIVSVK